MKIEKQTYQSPAILVVRDGGGGGSGLKRVLVSNT
jgi:hypothetical protein